MASLGATPKLAHPSHLAVVGPSTRLRRRSAIKAPSQAVPSAGGGPVVTAPAPVVATNAVAAPGALAAVTMLPAGLTAAAAFGATSALMVPVYGLMAFFPSAKLTRFSLLHPSTLYVGLAVLYAAVLVAAWSSGLGAVLGSALAAVKAAVVGGGGVAAVDLAPLASGLASGPQLTLLAWLHLLTLDALMAREIALDGLRTGVATAHSVLLCFFFGPTGLISHAITRLLKRS